MAGLNPKPAVIDIKAYDIGRMAAIQLLHRIRYPDSPQVKIQLIPELIPGQNWEDYNKKAIHYR
jgi:DNA-binding LacI/PurR family transcriptional regulator